MSAIDALNRLAKWRVLFAGWQLGTRAKGDPECDAVSDHRELSILLRVELTALTKLLLDKGIFTKEELDVALEEEADALNEMYEQRFPGVTASLDGLTFEPLRVLSWMKGWKS